MKIAQFQRAGDQPPLILILTEEAADRYARAFGPNEYLRLTEWADVDFMPRLDLAADWHRRLDAEEARVKAEAQRKLTEISTQRAQLRASEVAA